MRFVENDGGRAACGYKGSAGDCGVRSIAIATGRSYRQVYDDLTELLRTAKANARKRSKALRYKSTPRDGIPTAVAKQYMRQLGWEWTPTMGIGTGCTTHLDERELPSGRLVVALSRHWTAVIDGVIHDTYDPNDDRTYWTGEVRSGPRCVYGYWREVPA